MSVDRINYDYLAKTFDKSRALSHAKKDLWLRLFELHFNLNKTSRVLDVGCGTGRFAALIAEHFQSAVVGIDPSPSMLAKAREKCLAEIDWLLGRAESLPFVDCTFDVCLASQVVHHFHDRQQAFAEIYRVLRSGGRIGVRGSSHAQLGTILDYRFFPSAIQIECARLPDIPVIKSLMLSVGFSSVAEQSIWQELFKSTDDYLEKLQNRYASVLTLISNEEYQAGLARATVYLKGGSLKSEDRFAEITFLVGIK